MFTTISALAIVFFTFIVKAASGPDFAQLGSLVLIPACLWMCFAIYVDRHK